MLKIRAPPPNENIYSVTNRNASVEARIKQYQEHEEIDWIYEYKRQRQTQIHNKVSLVGDNWHQKLRSGMVSTVSVGRVWFALLLSAIVIGTMAAAVHDSTNWLFDLRTGRCKANFFASKDSCPEENWHNWGPWPLEFPLDLVAVVAFALCGFALSKVSDAIPRSRISAIRLTANGIVLPSFFTAKVLFAKTLSLVLVVGSGLWLGKEDPMVHLAACLMTLISKPWKIDQVASRELLAASIAAGISVGFNAPLGGVLFVLELNIVNLKVSRTLWKAFIGATIAIVVLQTWNPIFVDNNNYYFTIGNSSEWSTWEIAPFAIIGLVGGIFGHIFTTLNLQIAHWRKISIFNPNLVFCVYAGGSAVLSYFSVFREYSLSDVLISSFQNCDPDTTPESFFCSWQETPTKLYFALVAIVVQGFALTVFGYGLAIPAGILTPCMVMGACFGRSLGVVIDIIHKSHFLREGGSETSHIEMGAYAVIGAASFLAGITKMTVAIVVIMFEMTGALTYVLPIMIAVMIAKIVNDGFTHKNFYEQWAKFESLDALVIPEKPMPELFAKDVMVPEYHFHALYIDTVYTAQELKYLCHSSETATLVGFPVLSSENDRSLAGWISKNELKLELESLAQLEDIDPDQGVTFGNNANISNASTVFLGHLMAPVGTIPVLKTGLALSVLIELFHKLNYNFALVEDKSGDFAGVISKHGLIELVESNYTG